MREVLAARRPARPPIAKAAVSRPKRRCWNLVGSGAWAQVPAFDVEWEEGRVPGERRAAGLAPCPGTPVFTQAGTLRGHLQLL